MKVTELGSKGLTKEFSIVVEAAQINDLMEQELRRAGESVKIPGFRPGFIPMKILKQRYGKSVQADVLKHVINHASNDAIAERKLRPALPPKVDIKEYEDGGALTFVMTFETFPEVPEITFDKMTLDRSTFDITEKDIDETLARIAERSPRLARKPEGSKAQTGDVVCIDFKGMMGGAAFDGGSAADFRLELGSHQFIEGFEEQLVGTKEGDETKVKVTFPEDYPAKNLAGEEAVFEVSVKEVLRKELPAIDEEFAKTRGFADVKGLRDAVRGQMVREYEQVVRGQLKKQLFDLLDERYDFDLPQGMVDLEFNSIWERLMQAREEGDESAAGKSDDELKAEYRQIAHRRVKLGLLLAETGTRQKIQITREELSRAVMQQAGMFPGQEKKVMDFYRSNPDRIEDLRGPILEEKAVDYILGQVAFNDHKVSLDALAEQDEESDGSAGRRPASSRSGKPVKSAKKDEADGREKTPAKKKAASNKK